VNKRLGTSLLVIAVIALCSVAASAQKDKHSSKAKVVDSGTFGVYMGGRRVASETFTIRQTPESSVTTSQFKSADGHAAQESVLTLGPVGELRRYEWKELNPGKGQTVLEPQDEFLIERVKGSDNKSSEQPYLMPHTTMVLDDYFFSHRQILAWRYLAAGCKPKAGESGCPMAKAQFGIIVPRQRVSSMVSVEYMGREKTNVRGVERELNRINMSSDMGGDWALWFDDKHMLVRILIAGDNTEVLRD